ncbi:MAG: SLC13/DASS family transporter [Leptospiraceae bacterium]|nr:SLC13/DASS family transporter [Leptospiraceae bacterium]
MISTKKIIRILLFVFLPFTFVALPIDLPLHQKITLALIIMSLILWVTEAIPLYATGLLILIVEVALLSPVLKQSVPDFDRSIFYSSFFSDTIALFMGGMLLAEAIGKFHIDQWLLSKVMKSAGSGSARVLMMLLLTVAVLSMWISNTAATALGLILVQSLRNKIPDPINLFPFYLGIPFAANLGGMATPVGTPPNAIAMAILQKQNINITFAGWMAYMLPLTLIVLFALWRILLWRYKLPENIETGKTENLFKWDKSVRVILIVFFITIFLWLTSPVHGLPDGLIALLPALVFLALGILDTSDFRSINWDVLFLVGGGMALSAALGVTGTGALVASFLKFPGMPVILTTLIFAIAGVLLSNSMSNTATANLILPIVAIAFAGDNIFPMLIVTMAVSSAMSLPISTPPNALAYSSGSIPLKEMIISGSMTTAVALLTAFIPGYIWIPFLARFI